MDDGKQQEEDGDNDNGKSRVNILYCGGAFPMLEFKIGAGALEREEKCRKRHKSQFQKEAGKASYARTGTEW
ncbi:hypothetical protein Csa_003408 [Cucumis sativus]|uniref:Uncharacterized protein n=1 Tax=Cucumis sativus TaxID=3659 RepID=A0A0A0KDW4_CUCSA|nr:hypothetical protein Csa_003408 [Cucumis sativus]